MRRAMALIAMLGLVGNAWAAEDDPELAAALAKCPGAAAFVRADEQHRQALAQRLLLCLGHALIELSAHAARGGLPGRGRCDGCARRTARRGLVGLTDAVEIAALQVGLRPGAARRRNADRAHARDQQAFR